MKRTPKVLAKNYLFILIGSALYALVFNFFFAPNGIAFGGVTGLAQIVNHIIPTLSVGMMVFAFNIPIFLAGWWALGNYFLVSSLVSTVLISAFIDGFAALYTFPPMAEPLLACIFGGAGLGLSLGLVFLQGSSTGGSDILARLAQAKMSWLPIGKVLMVIDLTVILAVAFTFRSLDSALYGIVALYVCTLVMDWVLYGMDTSKVAYIISDKPEEIARVIMDEMERTVTYLQGEGGYLGQPKRVILCAFKQREIVTVKETVRQADPTAFMIVTSAHEVLGEGFKNYHENGL